jgi:hypothetical protein
MWAEIDRGQGMTTSSLTDPSLRDPRPRATALDLGIMPVSGFKLVTLMSWRMQTTN